MVARKPFGQQVAVGVGNDEGVVRREGEQRGEEGFGQCVHLLAGVLQEGFVPDAPVAVEIVSAVPGLVVLAAVQAFDACRTCIGAETHRAGRRAAEKGGGVALVAQDTRQLPRRCERLRHQHEGGLERGDRSQYGGQRLNRTGAVGVHAFEAVARLHERIQKRRVALDLPVGVEFGMEVGRVFGRHALHDEDHHVASFERCRADRVGTVDGRVDTVQFFRSEVAFVVDLSARPHGAQDAEGVREDQVGAGVVGGVERGVGERDGARHARDPPPHSRYGEQGGDDEQNRTAAIVAERTTAERFGARLAAAGQRQQSDQADPCEQQGDVLGHEFADELQRIVVVGEEDLFGRETFLRIAEIDRIAEVDRHDQQGVDDDVIEVEHPLPPAPFAQMERDEREHDEQGVGVEHRHGVEQQCTPCECR